MAGMYCINDLLNLVAREGADELHLEPGRPPVMVLQGTKRVIDGGVITSDNAAELFGSVASEEQRREFDLCGNTQFAFTAPNSARFYMRAAMERGNLLLRIRNLGRKS